ALGKFAGVAAVIGSITVGDGLGGDSVDVLRLDSSNQILDSSLVRVNSSGLFDLNGFVETLNGLTLQAGEVRTGTGTFTLGGNVTTIAAAAGTPDPTARIGGNLSLGAATRTFTVADDAA